MTLDKITERDQRARDALVDYSAGRISRGTVMDILRRCGWSQANIQKILDAADQNLINLGGTK